MRALTTEEQSYLNHKGSLSLPEPELQRTLIQCYFQYVHPFAPVIDYVDFTRRYKTGTISLLLLWSVFIAAGNASKNYPTFWFLVAANFQST